MNFSWIIISIYAILWQLEKMHSIGEGYLRPNALCLWLVNIINPLWIIFSLIKIFIW